MNKIEDGKVVPRTPEEMEAEQLAKPPKLAVVEEPKVDPALMWPVQESVLRPKSEIVLELLQDGQTEAAISTMPPADSIFRKFFIVACTR